MDRQYKVTYKVSGALSGYSNQGVPGDPQSGEITKSSAGHMWFSATDGHAIHSRGFASRDGEMFGPGRLVLNDNDAYQDTLYEVAVQLTKSQYEALLRFSEQAEKGGFGDYNVLINSCVDFVYASLKAIGYNPNGFQGDLLPGNNPDNLKTLLHGFGAQIIRDDLTRHGLYYEAKDGQTCLWLGASDQPNASPVTHDFSLKIDNAGTAKQKGSTNHEAEAADVAQGLVTSGGSHRVTSDSATLNINQYKGNWINNTFAAAATQILSDGYRPGNHNPTEEVFDFGLRNVATGLSYQGAMAALLNSGDARARQTLPTDPLILDLNGDGVRLTNYRDAPVFFDADNDGGNLEETGWVSPEDGIVVVDSNGNGKIDNISETLSEYFGGAAGTGGSAGEKRFANGFAALASLDSNADGVFDRNDAAWNTVKVWVDANHDGRSWEDSNGNGAPDAGERTELSSLDELGITQIDLHDQVQSGEVRNGNEVLSRGTFVQRGAIKEAVAASFIANPNGHTFTASGKGTVVTTQGSERVATVSSYASAASNGEHIDVSLKGVMNAAGDAGNDVLVGDGQSNWLAGGQGSDTFHGGAGDDVLLIDGDDLPGNIHGGEGTDIVQVVGDKGVFLELDKAGIEIAQGGRGNDTFIGGGTSTVYMRGGDGDDVLIGGAANDALAGEDGNDILLGGAGNDILRGHQGRDRLQGGAGDDLIDGGQDDDRLDGGAGDDVLIGGAGDDVIDGGDGDDAIELSGDFADYRISRTAEGVWITDTVAGRDGTDLLRNIEIANFRNLSKVQIPGSSSAGLENPLLVKDVLSHDKAGVAFDRTAPHLIGKEQLLGNDIDWQQDELHITGLFDVMGGTATLTDSGDVLFVPDPGFVGIMGFKYSAADGKGNVAATVVNSGSEESAVMRSTVYLRTADLPSDPLVAEQWYLSETNILPVWQHYTGQGVRIAQIETHSPFGTTKEIFDYRHADLRDNVDPAWLASATSGQTAGEGSEGKYSEHATQVAGVMVAARNGEGGVGVAYNATLAGYWISKDDFSNMDHMHQYDVVNNSWGSSLRFDLRFSEAKLGELPVAFRRALAHGRGGLGTVIVTAGGNDRQAGGNTNYSNITNTHSSIVVGAINAATDLGALQIGGQPFSSPGATILVSAPGSNITSTSRSVHTATGAVRGSETHSSQGTSFAAPVVSGIVALMLEANPGLGYRDVQEILALSARQVNDPGTKWQYNGSGRWNGGGMHVSHDYGYGQVDARAAVRLAETWHTQQTAANQYSLTQAPESGVLEMAISDGDKTGVRHSLTVNVANMKLEHVEVRIRLSHARPGDLIVILVSPSGTESALMDRPGKAKGSDDTNYGDSDFNQATTLDYVFSTALLRGENPKGDWTLKVIDTATGQSGTLHDWSLNIFGSGAIDDHYVYTDEFAKLATGSGRNVLHDKDGGRDAINVAAISSASVVDLSSGQAMLAGQQMTILDAEQIEDVIGGDHADRLVGNGTSNHLQGGRGDDTLIGGAGTDTLVGGSGSDLLTGGADADSFIIEKAAGDTDTITDFVIGQDKLVLAGFSATVYETMRISQQGADAQLSFANGQRVLLTNIDARLLTLASFVRLPETMRTSEIGRYAGYSFSTESSDRSMVLPDTSLGMLHVSGDIGEKVFGGNGGDTILGGLGNDVLVGENSTASLIGGDDLLNGREGDDVVRGGGGNDVLYGGSGLDYLGGDAGDDTLYLEGDLAITDYAFNSVLAPSVTLHGTASHTGAAVAGGAGNDRFVVVEDLTESASYGLLGNLIIDFEVNNPNEKIDLSQIRAVRDFSGLSFTPVVVDGEHYLKVWLGSMAAGSQYLTLKGVDAAQLSSSHFIFGEGAGLPKITINGTDANDLLVGDAGGNTLDGGRGADIMEGRLGDDTYLVDHEGDVVQEWAGGGYDRVKATISHTLAPEVEALQLLGHQAINAVGNQLDNHLRGNSANNVMDGGQGADVMVGAGGNDIYVVDNAADRLIELVGEGNDTVVSSLSFTLPEHVENLILAGRIPINATGNADSNLLRGNSSDNRLSGERGNDRMAGGQGNDRYVIGRGHGHDRIYEDFGAVGGIDTIVFEVGIKPEQVKAEHSDQGMLLLLGADQSILSGWNTAAGHSVERIEFADGTVWQTVDLISQTSAQGAGTNLQLSQFDQLVDAMAVFAPAPGVQSGPTLAPYTFWNVTLAGSV